MNSLAIFGLLVAAILTGCNGLPPSLIAGPGQKHFEFHKEVQITHSGSGTKSFSGNGPFGNGPFRGKQLMQKVDPNDLAAWLPMTAQQKQDQQWELIKSSVHDMKKLPTKFPPEKNDMAIIFDPNYLKVSFEYEGDQMPGTRNRMIFSPLAVVCKIKFNTFKNNTSGYTGLFHSGGIGIMRLALDGLSIPNFIVTGVFKIYIDGQKSRNFNLVKSIPGQKSNKNFFRDSFSNVIQRSSEDDAHVEGAFNETIKILKGGPLDRPENGFTLGLYEQASIESDGTPVKGRIVAPYEGRCTPNPALAIDANSKNDFRVDINKVVKPGQQMYTYWGRRTPESKTWELIGEIVADSECLASEYGDQKLFFQQPQRRWSLN